MGERPTGVCYCCGKTANAVYGMERIPERDMPPGMQASRAEARAREIPAQQLDPHIYLCLACARSPA